MSKSVIRRGLDTLSRWPDRVVGRVDTGGTLAPPAGPGGSGADEVQPPRLGAALEVVDRERARRPGLQLTQQRQRVVRGEQHQALDRLHRLEGTEDRGVPDG